MPLTAAEAQRRLAALRTPQDKRSKPWQLLQKTFGIQTAFYDLSFEQQVGAGIRGLGFLNRGLTLNKLTGKMRPTLEKAMKIAATLPYQSGGGRLPFRAHNVTGTTDKHVGRMVMACMRLNYLYDQPIEWFAEWCGYVEDDYETLGMDVLLACEIDSGNTVVLNTLIDSLNGTHPIGIPSKAGIRALLRSNNPGAWGHIAKMLLNAQRAEGLRQAIVECLDELNPVSFQRFCRLIIEHNLLRFSSVIRSFIMWFPGLVQEGKIKSAEQVLMRMLEFMDDAKLRPEPNFNDTYLRLWVDAFHDVDIAIARGQELIPSQEVEVRRAVADIASAILLTSTQPLIERILKDRDRRVSAYGIRYVASLHHDTYRQKFHDVVLGLAKEWPKTTGEDVGLTRSDVWEAAFNSSPTDWFEYYFDCIHELPVEARTALARRLPDVKNARLRKRAALHFAADSSAWVRMEAFKVFAKISIGPEEAVELEALLTRKVADLRTAVLHALSRQNDPAALASATRLVASKDAKQRLGGQELAQQLVKRGVRQASALIADQPKPPSDGSAKDMFGLMDISQITFVDKPKSVGVASLYEGSALAIISHFGRYLESRANELAVVHVHWETKEMPIGDIAAHNLTHWQKNTKAEMVEMVPLIAEVEAWYEPYMPTTEQGWADLIRAYVIARYAFNEKRLPLDVAKDIQSKGIALPIHISATAGFLMWILRDRAIPGNVLLELIANEIAKTADDKYNQHTSYGSPTEDSWRKRHVLVTLCELVRQAAKSESAHFTPQDWTTAFRLFRYIDEPAGREARAKVEQLHEELKARREDQFRWYNREVESRRTLKVPHRDPVPMAIVSHAYAGGGCSKADVLDNVRFDVGHATQMANSFTPPFRAVVQELVDRLIDIESQRGDLKTEATYYTGQISGLIHLDHVIKILSSGTPLARTGYWSSTDLSRGKSFARILSFSRPLTSQTHEICAAAFTKAKVKPERLVELAMLSPHWARSIERALGWPGLEDAVWWLHAHTKDQGWGVPQELKEIWEGEISERTRLTSNQLENGACDPEWFHRFWAQLDPKQWKLLDKNAKFACSGTGHSRALTFARALSGEFKVGELAELILSKRNPNHVRALGLIPLGDDPETDIKHRYGVLQEFLAGSRQFGSMKQTTEKLAFEIAIENLAFTAGYPDALRLIWAVEAAEVQDLKGDGASVTVDELTVRLFFDILGQPTVEASKAGKLLKEIPAAAKKLPEIKALTERRAGLKKQLSRMRMALEQAMQRADQFTAAELASLVDHPGLRPLLQNLVFIGESGAADFPDEQGKVGDETGMLRIAHPFDLLERGDWPDWQEQIFREERIQPFKQVFRELYVPTLAEKEQSAVTRYGGHQVKPMQALAILNKRGWVARHEEGVSKTYHHLNLTARIDLDYVGYSPADVEGATLDKLVFTRPGSWEPLPLTDVPPLAFSETLRDLDLIVSVASVVGVDPEASESTVEMRQRVVEQTCKLLRLPNVSYIPRHAVIEGSLASYTVNLSSATVHQRARGELVIVAVRQPQRGRLFLPFVDDDPRTAELVSKVILLARDDEIKDPSILGQIVGARA